MDLRKLAEPFHPGQIRWRVGPNGMDDENNRAWCLVYPYVTSRAIQRRLDKDVGVENWCNTPARVFEVVPGVYAVEVGISIRVNDTWVTKYGVGSASEHEPQKGAHSSAMKRAALQFGIGGYLDAIPQMYPKTSLKSVKDWNQGNLGKNHAYKKFWWETPKLPGFALPREDDVEKPVTEKEVNNLKKAWAAKFATRESDPVVRLQAFTDFVSKTIGTIQVNDPECWTQNSLKEVRQRIDDTTDGGNGPSSDIPFG